MTAAPCVARVSASAESTRPSSGNRVTRRGLWHSRGLDRERDAPKLRHCRHAETKTPGHPRLRPAGSRLLIALYGRPARPRPAPALAAPKTDVLVFDNGDRLTGEVKGLERGKLSFKTDATGTIEVEWDKVASLQSEQYLEVELLDGLRYFGRAPQAQAEGKLSCAWSRRIPRAGTCRCADVIRIAPIEQGGSIDRLDGYVTAGYDYTKANDLQQFTFTGGLTSRNEKRQWSLDGDTTLTSQPARKTRPATTSARVNRRFLADRWFWQGFGSFEGNDELDLDLRTTLGGAYGRFLSQTPAARSGPPMRAWPSPARISASSRRTRASRACSAPSTGSSATTPRRLRSTPR